MEKVTIISSSFSTPSTSQKDEEPWPPPQELETMSGARRQLGSGSQSGMSGSQVRVGQPDHCREAVRSKVGQEPNGLPARTPSKRQRFCREIIWEQATV